jgi:hypothetical protein
MLQRLVGLGFVGLAIWFASDAYSFRRDGVVVPGVVVGTERQLEVSTDGISLMNRPIIEYRPAAGAAPIRFKSDVWTAWRSHQKGDAISVRHRPGDPRSARVDSVVNDALLPGIFLLLGIGALLGRLESSREWVWFRQRWED